MITTVTLNPCIDLTVRVPGLKEGGLNLVTSTRTDVTGKGINVSMVLREFGLATICTGINFDGNGAQLTDRLEENSISSRFAMAHGNIRTNIKVFDESKKETTEVNQWGDPVEEVVLDQYFELLRECAAGSDLVVFSGRIPNQAKDDIYRRSIKAIRNLPCRVIVDAEGKPLQKALLQKPYLIKPNLYELELLLRRKLTDRQAALAGCREIIARGVQVVCLSMGGDGAMIVDAEQAFYAPALPLEVKGPQGAGDSMVAGICKALKEKLGPEDMLRYGVAAAAATLIREGTQLCRRDDFQKFLPLVRVEAL